MFLLQMLFPKAQVFFKYLTVLLLGLTILVITLYNTSVTFEQVNMEEKVSILEISDTTVQTFSQEESVKWAETTWILQTPGLLSHGSNIVLF